MPSFRLQLRCATILCVLLLLLPGVFAESKKAADAPESLDATWAPYPGEEPLAPKEIVTTNFYLTMRDGVKIAVSLYLPKALPEGEKRPTILHSTRYMRAYALRAPFKGREVPQPRICRFLANGYVWVSVDARGSGASYGTWPCPWAPNEVKDYGEVCDWIVKQPWSNGLIGCCGISYDGTSAEMTATNVHPAIKALVPEFSLFDSYSDVAFPGGIVLSEFLRKWSEGNALIDADAVRKSLKGMERWVFKGVRPVDADKDRSLLKAAVASHQWNGDVYRDCSAMNFRDDLWRDAPDLSLAEVSPSGKVAELRTAAMPIYSYSGWFDGAYQHSAIKRYLTVANPGSKLVIGPWSHAGRYNSGPYVQATTAFDHVGELLRFFDHYLKGVDNGIDAEPPIHYYTMVEEKWKSCDKWPPAATATTYYFRTDNQLATTKPSEEAASDVYEVDYTAGTGLHARWDSLLGGTLVTYPDRALEDTKLLTYTSVPLDADTEVTGHPLATLYIASTASDGQFFVYLEDVDEQGTVHYVTEGELRALCRNPGSDPAPYKDAVPYRSFLRKDAETLTPGQTTELTFDLLPTSYLFKKGHRIRIALAGADKDHFHPPYFAPPTVTYSRDAAHASHVTLPIVPR